jgi:hypothetical protein
MRPDLQHSFADRVTNASYERFRADLDAWLGVPIRFRVCEMPIFVDHAFRAVLEDAARAIVQQCIRPTYLARTERTLTPETTVRGENDRPLFSVVDFAVCRDPDGRPLPKLIELQGFPSLLGYQYLFASRMREAYGLTDATPFFSDLDHDRYMSILRTSIFAGHDPNEVALVEIDPDEQKTRPDFIALEKLIGLQTVNIRDLVLEGRTLVFRTADGRMQRLRRIFNRAIVDELNDLGVALPFRWNDDLDVEWAGHPNWYFRISKYSLPFLDHPSVPRTTFLHELTEIPTDLDRHVLKPLYAFAGKGVVVGPTEADINAIATDVRDAWILQERVEYDPCIYTPHGMNKVEIRVMLIWPDEANAPIPVMSLARTGRGALMGARYNTDPWTGSSGCLFV